jgi:aspartokinase-like uncharacterized kinase
MTIEGLHHGFDPDWGWWVSADLVRRVYSSFSLDDALVNWWALQAAPTTKAAAHA